MANCMTCAHQAEIDRLREICLRCSSGGQGCGISHKGRSHVSLDAAKAPSSVLCHRSADWRSPGSAEEATLESPCQPGERERHLQLLQMFAKLGGDWDDSGLILGMLSGKTLEVMSKERGVSIQSLHARWKRIIGDNPAWGSLANGMIGSGVGRKPARKGKQMELW